jgi:4-hydroxyphenylpyruvate dioxygenase
MPSDLPSRSDALKAAADPLHNPLGTAGLEFVEFAARDPQALARMFGQLGFKPIARHVSKDVTLYRQGEMNFLLNAEPDSFAARYAQEYGAGICALGLRVADAQAAYDRAIGLGAWSFEGERVGNGELVIPAIQGIGDSHMYFVDRWRGRGGLRGGVGDISIFDIDFRPVEIDTAQADLNHAGTGLIAVDHLTQTVGAGRMQEWLDFYHDLLNFREIRELHANWHISADSRVMVSPCGAIRIPLYEEGTRRTDLMHAYLPDHPGEGVQHIALATADIVACVERLAANGVEMVEPPARYYEQIDARLPGHGLDLARLQRGRILVDGEMGADGVPLLFFQTFVRRGPGRDFLRDRAAQRASRLRRRQSRRARAGARCLKPCRRTPASRAGAAGLGARRLGRRQRDVRTGRHPQYLGVFFAGRDGGVTGAAVEIEAVARVQMRGGVKLRIQAHAAADHVEKFLALVASPVVERVERMRGNADAKRQHRLVREVGGEQLHLVAAIRVTLAGALASQRAPAAGAGNRRRAEQLADFDLQTEHDLLQDVERGRHQPVFHFRQGRTRYAA